MNSYQNQHSLRRPLKHGLFHEDYCNELIRDQNLPFPNTYQRWEMGICPNTYRKRVRKMAGKIPTHLCKRSRAYHLPGRTKGQGHTTYQAGQTALTTSNTNISTTKPITHPTTDKEKTGKHFHNVFSLTGRKTHPKPPHKQEWAGLTWVLWLQRLPICPVEGPEETESTELMTTG